MGIFYKRIRDMREDNDKTQQDIANIINVGLTTYRRWETGERTIPTNYLVTLALYYQVSTDYLLGLTNDPKPPKAIKNQVNINGGKNKINMS